MVSESLQQTALRAVGETNTQRGEGGRGMRLVTLRAEGDRTVDLTFDPRLTIVVDPEPQEITQLLDDAARYRQRGLELVAELSEQTIGPIPEGTFGTTQSFRRSRDELHELLQTLREASSKARAYAEKRAELEARGDALLSERPQIRSQYDEQVEQMGILQGEMQRHLEQCGGVRQAFEGVRAVDLQRTRARQLAEQWVETKSGFLQLPQPDPSLPAAMATNERQLRQAQHQLREATAKAKQLTPEEEVRLREAHQNLENAQRDVEKRANRHGLKALEEAEQAEVALLKELDLMSYLDFILSISVPEADKARILKEAKSKLIAAESEQAALSERYTLATEFEHLKERIRTLRTESMEILGVDPGPDANTQLLQFADYKNPRQEYREVLISALREAHVDQGSDPMPAAEKWLEDQASIDIQNHERLKSLTAAISQNESLVKDLEQELLSVEAELRQVSTLEDEQSASIDNAFPIVVDDQFIHASGMDESFGLLGELGEFIQVIIVSGDPAVIQRARALPHADVREVRPLPEGIGEIFAPLPTSPIETVPSVPAAPFDEPKVVQEDWISELQRGAIEPAKTTRPEKPVHKFRRQKKIEIEKVANEVAPSAPTAPVTPAQPKKLGRCRRHQVLAATARCANCKNAYCDECLLKVTPRKQLCLDCALKLSGVHTGWHR